VASGPEVRTAHRELIATLCYWPRATRRRVFVVITPMLAVSTRPGPLHDSIHPNEIGDSGHSDGGSPPPPPPTTPVASPRASKLPPPSKGSVRFPKGMVPNPAPAGDVRLGHRGRNQPLPGQRFHVRAGPVAQVPADHRRRLAPEVLVGPPWEPPIAQ